MLVEKGIPFVITPTKVDKLSKTELAHQIHKIAEAYGLPTQLFLPFSSSSGCGRKEVWRVIHDSILRKGIAHSWSLES
jgi:GTP-binding protein EngB required for normal cell division